MCFPYIEQEEPNRFSRPSLVVDDLLVIVSHGIFPFKATISLHICLSILCPSVLLSPLLHLIHGHDEHSFHFITICDLSCLSNFQISTFTMMFFSTKKYHWIHLLMVQGESWFFSLPDSNSRHCDKLPFRRRSIYWMLPRNWQSVWWLLVWTRLRWLFLYKSTLPCS